MGFLKENECYANPALVRTLNHKICLRFSNSVPYLYLHFSIQCGAQTQRESAGTHSFLSSYSIVGGGGAEAVKSILIKMYESCLPGEIYNNIKNLIVN